MTLMESAEWLPLGDASPSAPMSLEDLRVVLARVTLDSLDTRRLPMIASWALIGGVDTPLMRELAGMPSNDVRDARDVFIRSLDELGVRFDPITARQELVMYWAREMLTGQLPPIRGSRLIWYGWQELGRPDALTPFVGLASQWDDQGVGPSERSDLERDMLEEAQRLVEES